MSQSGPEIAAGIDTIPMRCNMMMEYPFIPDFLYAPVVYEEMCDYTV
jgi:hypothetical protein